MQTTVRGLQVKTKGCTNKIYGILYISLEDLNERRKKQAKVWRHSKITRSGNNLPPLIISSLLVDVIRDSQSVFSESETSPLYRNPRPWTNLYFRRCARYISYKYVFRHFVILASCRRSAWKERRLRSLAFQRAQRKASLWFTFNLRKSLVVAT